MLISERIPLDVEAVIREIRERQGLPWNNGRINEYSNYGILQKLFVYMNSGIPEEDFFYKGNLFRIHSSYVEHVSRVDSSREIIVSSSDDGSCSVLPVTEYSAALVSFSKNHDFTRRCYNKIIPDEKAVMFYCNTGNKYGIDVNAFLRKYDSRNERYEDEQEVLFPLQEEYVIREYKCTPNRFNYFLRGL